MNAGVDAGLSLAPVGLLAVLAASALYARRWFAFPEGTFPTWRALSFAAGMTVIVIALASPLARVGEQSFFIHMAQHLLLLDVAAVLVLLGLAPEILGSLGDRLRRPRGVLAMALHPLFAVAFYASVLWVWHVPALYEAALRNTVVHAAFHACLVIAGLVLWIHVVSPVPIPGPKGMAVGAYLGTTKVITGALGSALAFSALGSYSFYENQPRPWELSWREDQQLAGALLMTLELVLMTAGFAVMFVRMLGETGDPDEALD